jgi:hypothetical protein
MQDWNYYLQDDDLPAVKKLVDEDIARARLLLRKGENVVIRYDDVDRKWLVGRDLAVNGSPEIYTYIQTELDKLRGEYEAGDVKAPAVIPPALPGNMANHIRPADAPKFGERVGDEEPEHQEDL